MRVIKLFRKIVLYGILIGCFIFIIFDFLSYNLDLKAISSTMAQEAALQKIDSVNYLKETNDKNLKIILFGKNENNFGLGVFEKSRYPFSIDKYKKISISKLENTNASFAHKFQNNVYYVIVGYNENKKADYIIIEDGHGKKVKEDLESGYYTKIILSKDDYFNYYDKNGKKIDIQYK